MILKVKQIIIYLYELGQFECREEREDTPLTQQLTLGRTCVKGRKDGRKEEESEGEIKRTGRNRRIEYMNAYVHFVTACSLCMS